MMAAAAIATIGSSCGADDGDAVVVFAASSLGDVMEALAERFEATSGTVVEVNVAGSSTLRLQLDEGASADVFAPADPRQLDDLTVSVDGEPTIVATTELVVAVGVDGEPVGIERFDETDLVLGACAPAVPCGAYARDAFDAAGVDPALDTEEPDVRSVAAKVAEGELDAGVVYATDVAADDRLTAVSIAPQVVVSYPVVLLTDAASSGDAQAFIEFLAGAEGAAVFADFGFDSP